MKTSKLKIPKGDRSRILAQPPTSSSLHKQNNLQIISANSTARKIAKFWRIARKMSERAYRSTISGDPWLVDGDLEFFLAFDSPTGLVDED